MRLLALAVAVALSGCSLIRTTMPEPASAWSQRSDCVDSYTPPVVDGVIAGVGGLSIGGGAILIAQGQDSTGHSTVGQGVLGIGVGVAVVGLFATSAILGVRRVGACHEGLAEWDRREGDRRERDEALRAEAARAAAASEARRAAEQERREQLAAAGARDFLKCADGPLESRVVVPPIGNDPAWIEVVGCGRDAWCKVVDPPSCGPSHALGTVLQQLAVETGCGIEKITQLERLNLKTQVTYRLDACGNTFACTTLVDADSAAVSRFGSTISCKAVPPAKP